MKIDGLGVPPFNTTLLGVLKGVLDYYEIDVSGPMAFGGSGHAFLINIHKQLCPSGPYCWKADGFARLIGNLGLERTDLGFFSPTNSPAERQGVEDELHAALDQGIACSLCNFENQLITGYDEAGFFTTQPWAPHMNFPPARLSFGSWEEFGKQFHVNFYTFRKTAWADAKTTILDSLDYAVELHQDPLAYSLEAFGIGPDAYANWKAAAEEYGASHGNWWNATVWSECRKMAGEYFTEIAGAYTQVSDAAADLTSAYTEIADGLGRLSDKEMPASDKIELLDQVQSQEQQAIEAVAALAAALRSAGEG